jgi:hypothetical protein
MSCFGIAPMVRVVQAKATLGGQSLAEERCHCSAQPLVTPALNCSCYSADRQLRMSAGYRPRRQRVFKLAIVPSFVSQGW